MSTRIEATRLIPGRGDVIENGVVVMDEGVISFAGTAADAPETPDADVVTTDTVMPGMWECHGHFIGIYTANIDEAFTTRPQLAAMRVTADARRVLDAGFTSVREMGGLGSFLSRSIEEGVVVGPNVYASGGMLSMTAGHGDSHSLDLDTARLLHTHVWGEDNIVDGPDQCRAGVRRMLRLGAKVIKIHASGGVLSELDDPHLPQFSKEELEAIVDEATRMERLVGAHCHGKRGIMAALEAGVRTIEHGTFMDEEAAEAMVETGAILVPTRFIVDLLIREGEKRGMPEYAKKKIEMTAESHADGVALAIEKGVRIALGTDIWATGVWGRNAEELPLMVACGMTPLQAIEMATANGPATLGPQAPNTGQLKEGMDADVICVSGDPLADIAVLADPANVTQVFKGGVKYKG
ncbi:MAG TPA: amidohydrolase family protein [Acidimicrobiia bacterium]|jgi:imidazolonepropionase-like amidohydrolase|nr:amidohydrolase family protein [Acidimicrobiia bacterium]